MPRIDAKFGPVRVTGDDHGALSVRADLSNPFWIEAYGDDLFGFVVIRTAQGEMTIEVDGIAQARVVAGGLGRKFSTRMEAAE